MQHAKLSPSSSSRWLSCTASVEASKSYENKSNSASTWGTCVHYMGEQLLLGVTLTIGDDLHEQGVDFTVDKEMLDTAEEYADYCRSLTNKTSVIMIEERFDLTFIAPETFGTGDFSVLNGTHLDIVDLKTGHGIVYAENNTQLMMYALGAMHELEDIYDIETVTLHIAQGRANHYDTWETTAHDLRQFEAYAKGQAEKILSGDTEFNPTAKGCQWCAHKFNCEALKNHVDDVVTGGFDNLEEIEGKADIIDSEHVKKILDNADLITGFVKAVQQVALERMEAGEEIKGYKLVASKTNRKWRDEEEVAKYLNRKIKAEDLWTKKLIPMTKILKMRPKDKKLQEMLVKPDGKPQVAPESDKREAIGAVLDQFDEC